MVTSLITTSQMAAIYRILELSALKVNLHLEMERSSPSSMKAETAML